MTEGSASIEKKEYSKMRLLLPGYSIAGGIETMSVQLICQFITLVDKVVLVIPAHIIPTYQRLLPQADNLIYEPLHWEKPAPPAFLDAVAKRATHVNFLTASAAQLREQLIQKRFQYLVKKYRITHCFCAWTTQVVIPEVSVPMGAAILDVNWKIYPQNFKDTPAELLDSDFQNWLEKADIVFPISNFVLSQVGEFFQMPCCAKVVPLASKAKPLQSRSSGERKYFFYPASVFAHKNHIGLLKTVLSLIEQGYDCHLILSGLETDRLLGKIPFPAAASEACRLFLEKHADKLASRITARGYVSRAELEQLYANCLAVVIPSSYEGFGLPLVEALERGLEVVCSDIPPFLEQIALYKAGERVRLFKSGNEDDLGQHMIDLIERGSQPPLEGEELFEMMARWTWKDVALKYLEHFAELS